MNKSLLIALVGIVLCQSCKQKAAETEQAEPVQNSYRETAANSIRSMETSVYEDTMTYRSQLYGYRVERRADLTLPKVKDEDGVSFSDNSISLYVMREGKSVFRKTYTKEALAAYIPSDFMKKGVLEGLVFYKTDASGMLFIASVCYPQTDLYAPVLITISADGGVKYAYAGGMNLDE